MGRSSQRTIAGDVEVVLNALIKMQSDSQVIHRSVDEFDPDPDPYHPNTRNGVIDLRTGEALAHRPTHLCTQTAEVVYNGGATAAQ